MTERLTLSLFSKALNGKHKAVSEDSEKQVKTTSRAISVPVARITSVFTGGGIGGLVTESCPTLATPWTVACQAPLSTRFSKQEYWSGLPFPSPGDLPVPGIEPGSPALQADSLPS